MIAGLAILCVPALLELALWFSYFLLPFGLMLGLAIGPVPTGSRSLRLPWHWVFPAAALIGMPTLVLATRDHLRAEHVQWLSQLARSPDALAGAAAKVIPHATRELNLFAVWGEYEALRFGEEKKEDLPGQLAANERLLHNIPDPHIVARQVMLEALAGHSDKARDFFRRMIVFFPEYYEALAAELRIRAGTRPKETRELLEILDEEMANPPRRRGAS